MPDEPHHHRDYWEQPYLHDLVCLLAAPMQAWTATDGSIAANAGAQGIYVGDTRVVRQLSIRADGWAIVHLATDDALAGRQELHSVLRRGDAVIDPELMLIRERILDGHALTERLSVLNASPRALDLVLAVHLGPDATPMDVIKAGGTQVGGMDVDDEGWSTEDGSVRVRITTDGDCVRTPQGFALSWHLAVPAGEAVTGSWSLQAAEAGAVVTAPASRIVAAAADRIAIPEGREFDLGRLVRRAMDDLGALEMAIPGMAEAPFIGAGAPWFLTLFGRDSIVTARLLLPVVPQIAYGTLTTLGLLQGTTDDELTAEAPGRIIHELRREVTRRVGSADHYVLPPRYYGTVDATPLWISLLHDAWRAGMPPDEVAALVPNLEAAVSWLRIVVAADPRGFLAYRQPAGRGLANQGWKDSGDAIRWADGSRAIGPIALCEVQGYAARAARQAADLLDAHGRTGAADLRSWADEIAERFRAAFWVTDRTTGAGYPAIALDAKGRAVDGMASNMGHLLGTGILDASEQRAVVDRLMDPVMFSGFGIRTLSSTNGGYWPLRYHAGAVWPHDTALIIDGMLADGFTDEAKLVAEGLLAAAASFDWRLPELFSGVSREESTQAIPYPAACRPQAWSAAACVVVARALRESMLAWSIGAKPRSPEDGYGGRM